MRAITPAKRGPNTEQGRARSSRNATKHGILSRQIVLADEDPVELQDLCSRLHQQYAPVGPMEIILVDRICVAVRRLARIFRAETASMDKTYADVFPTGDGLTPAVHRQRALMSSVNNTWLAPIHRYAISTERQLYKAIHELHCLQASRLTGISLIPGAIRVTLEAPPPALSQPDPLLDK